MSIQKSSRSAPFGDGANANYNGLLIAVQHRFTHNFTLLANHTWSHCLTESEIGLNGAGFGQDPYNRGLPDGPLDTIRHALLGSVRVESGRVAAICQLGTAANVSAMG